MTSPTARRRRAGSEKRRIKKTKELVFQRDGWQCVHCHWSPLNPKKKNNYLTLDHIIPFFEGGPTTLDNCQTLCNLCNQKKSKEESNRANRLPGQVADLERRRAVHEQFLVTHPAYRQPAESE